MIDREEAEKWVGVYIKEFKMLPSESLERSTHIPSPPSPSLMFELQAILRIRPRFLERFATQEQIEWLSKQGGRLEPVRILKVEDRKHRFSVSS